MKAEHPKPDPMADTEQPSDSEYEKLRHKERERLYQQQESSSDEWAWPVAARQRASSEEAESIKASGVQETSGPMVPPIESGPVTVRSGVGPGSYNVEQAERDVPVSAEDPASGVRSIGGEMKGRELRRTEREELAFAKHENLPPYAPSVLEEDEEKEGREEAA